LRGDFGSNVVEAQTRAVALLVSMDKSKGLWLAALCCTGFLKCNDALDTSVGKKKKDKHLPQDGNSPEQR
jgi:hypothetical protein